MLRVRPSFTGGFNGFRSVALLAALLLTATWAGCGEPPVEDGGANAPAPDVTGINDLGSADQGEGTDAAVPVDQGPVDVVPVEVAPSCPGGATCPCTENSKCDGGLCIDTPAGKHCAAPCTTTCPAEFKCASISGTDVTTVCVPMWGKLCNPCLTSQACTALGQAAPACVVHGDGGAFCGSECTADANCPTGHTCQELKSVEGTNTKQCAPAVSAGAIGACACSPAAVQATLSTKCMAQTKAQDGTVLGSCAGQRQCGKDGLTACNAAAATPEVCDGQDNDCNGKTDDASCDDGNACTQDLCAAAPDKTVKCQHSAVESACDADKSPCTEGDACKDGVCLAGAAKACDDGNPCTLEGCDPVLGCTKADDDGAPCNDDNPCTIGDLCQTAQCLAGIAKPCTSTDECQTAKCDQVDGKCVFTDKQDGLPCNDATVCTSADVCDSGACGGTIIVCDDGNPCSVDACDDVTGCTASHFTGSCSDGNACTVDDACKAGACAAGAALACDDNDGCTLDTCDPATGLCANAAVVGCGGNCKVDGDCSDGNPCTDDTCVLLEAGKPNNGGKCSVQPNVATCDDGEICTDKDVCKGGVCSGAAIACNDSNPCTTDSCTPGKGCVHAANTIVCDDANACTKGDVCSAAKCMPGAAVTCNDNKPCTSDSCNTKTGACEYVANTLACNDSNACTTGDVCAASVCKPGTAKACDDKNGCTDDKCDPVSGSCVVTNNTAACTDGNACTGVSDACSGGACKPGVAKICDDKNACTTDSCDTATGACKTAAIIGCGGNCTSVANCDDKNPCTTDTCTAAKCANTANTGSCTDNDGCTVGDVCGGGVCKKGVVKVCNDANPCTNDSCTVATGACAVANNTLACNDNDACTTGDLCTAGKCAPGKAIDCDDKNPCTTGDTCKLGSCIVGTPVVCDDKNPCTKDSCDSTGKCALANDNTATCSDNVPCTVGDACLNGACKAGNQNTCDDKNVCTTDACDALTGKCVNAVNTLAECDGSFCTKGDVCSGGLCKAGVATNCDDKNACTSDSCEVANGKCAYKFLANTVPCSDGSACTSGDKCDGAGKCVGPVLVLCKNSACTDSSCNPSSGLCEPKFKPNTTLCDDVQTCTVGDKCDGAGKCVSGPWDPTCGCQNDTACNDKNPCTTDKCVSLKCQFTITAGATCDDADVCSTASTCSAGGKCTATTLVDCKGANDACNTGSCIDSGGAPACKKVPVAAGTACSDGLFCTTGDACDVAGKCAGGTPPLCGKPAQCFTSFCSEAAKGCTTGFQPTGNPCTDNSVCTDGDACNAGKCIGTLKASCTPKLTGFTPATPSQTAATSADGTGGASTTVYLYPSANCTGTPYIAAGTPAAPGFNVKFTAATQKCTAVSALAKDAAGTTSACSNSLTYNHYSCTQCPCSGSDWIRRFGGPKNDTGSDVATDAVGNSYVVGNTEGDFPPNKSSGLNDGFITKMDTNGKRLWTERLGTTANDSLNAVAVDGGGFPWGAGTTAGDLDVAGPGVAPAAGDTDAYVVKVDMNSGQMHMVKIYGTKTRTEAAIDIAYDAVGKRLLVLVASENPGGGGLSAVVVAVDTTSGTITPFWSFLDNGQNKNPVALHVDSLGAVYVHGRAQFNYPGALSTNGAANGGMYIVKIGTDGKQLWATQWGSPEFDYAGGITSDGAGNLFATGFVQGVATGTAVGTKYLGSTGVEWGHLGDVVVGSFAAATGAQKWVTQVGTAGGDGGAGVAYFPATNLAAAALYVTANTSGNFTDGTGTAKYGLRDFALLKFATTGAVQAKRQLGTTGNDSAGRPTRFGTTLFVTGSSEADWVGQSPDACLPMGLREVFVGKFCTVQGISTL